MLFQIRKLYGCWLRVIFANFRFLTEDLCSKACRPPERVQTSVPSTTSTVATTTLSQTTKSTAVTTDIITADRLNGTRITVLSYRRRHS